MKRKMLYFLTHPLVLTVFIGTVILILIPPVFNKYNARLVHTSQHPKTTTNTWVDFDNDGFSEEVSLYNTPQQPSVIIRRNKKIIAEWILQGEFVHIQFFFPADFNHDGNQELYVVTCSKDSLFIHGIEPFRDPGKLFLRKYLDKYKTSVTGNDCAVYFIKATDLNGDGYHELVFSISTGWSAYPRKIYAVDIANDTIFTSPESCVPLINPVGYDINDDGFDEFLPETYAFRNCSGLESYPDHLAWIMVFDRKLNYLFKPLGIGQYMSAIKIRPIRIDGKTYLIVLQIHAGTEAIGNTLMLYSVDGMMLRKKELDDYPELQGASLITTHESDMNHVYLLYADGKVGRIDDRLTMSEKVYIKGSYIQTLVRIDIDLDGFDEFIISSVDQRQLFLTRNDFTNPVILNTPFTDQGAAKYLSVIRSGNKNNRLYFQSGENCYIFDYFKNPLYLFKYPIYIVIFLILYMLFYLVHKAQTIRARHRYETETKIAELQLKSIKGQTDPHFTLNLLNSLGALFDKQDKRKAGYIFGKYANLLRMTILGSDDIESPLADEIEFVKNYLELEKFRYNDKFIYQVRTIQEIDLNIPVPKMLIHTFAENSVKHGIRHIDSNGLITIDVGKDLDHYTITIEDNGAGRSKAAGYAGEGTGKGLKILDDILRLYYGLRNLNITYEISDRVEADGVVTGTSVVIRIPFDKKRDAGIGNTQRT